MTTDNFLETGLLVRGKQLFVKDVTADEMGAIKTVLEGLFNSQRVLLNQIEEELGEYQIQKDQYRTSQFMLQVLPVMLRNSSESEGSEVKAVERALRISRIASQRLSTYKREQ